MDLDHWRERIKTAADDQALGLTAEIAADDKALGQVRLPAVLVVPGRERVKTSHMIGPNRHRVEIEVLVLTGVRRGNAALGGEMVEKSEAIRTATKDQLIDWLPPGAETEIEWAGGQILDLTADAYWWVDAYKTEYWRN